MRKNKPLSKLLLMLVSVAMIFSIMPMTAFADEDAGDTTQSSDFSAETAQTDDDGTDDLTLPNDATDDTNGAELEEAEQAAEPENNDDQENVKLMSDAQIKARFTLSGSPVAGAQVTLNESGSYRSGDYVNTDINGKVTIADLGYYGLLDSEKSYYFTVQAGEGFTKYDGDLSGEHFYPGDEVREIILKPAHSVTTRVTLSGEPIEGVEVYVCSEYTDSYGDAVECWWEHGYTDSDGYVTFDHLPAGEVLFFQVYRSDNYIDYDGRSLGKTFTLPGGNAPIIELDPGLSYSTTVTFQGNPVPDLKVALNADDSWRWRYAITDENGVAEFSAIAPGNYYFSVDAPGGAPFADYEGNTFSLPGTMPKIELVLGHTVATTVTLEGTLARISGLNYSYPKAAPTPFLLIHTHGQTGTELRHLKIYPTTAPVFLG